MAKRKDKTVLNSSELVLDLKFIQLLCDQSTISQVNGKERFDFTQMVLPLGEIRPYR
jgi:hypothetical protein